MPAGFTPPVPGLTESSGVTPDTMGPMGMLAMMMGKSPQPDATQDKMAQVVQLLREIAKSDPRAGMIASDALRVLIEGPPPMGGASPPPGLGSPTMGGPPPGPGGMLAGSPGG